MQTQQQIVEESIAQLMKSWREGTLSDVETLFGLCSLLPASPMTDMLIEVVGKMYQEYVAEWPMPDEEREALANLIHFEPNR